MIFVNAIIIQNKISNISLHTPKSVPRPTNDLWPTSWKHCQRYLKSSQQLTTVTKMSKEQAAKRGLRPIFVSFVPPSSELIWHNQYESVVQRSNLVTNRYKWQQTHFLGIMYKLIYFILLDSYYILGYKL